MPNYLTFGKEKIEYKKLSRKTREFKGQFLHFEKLDLNSKFKKWILSHLNPKNNKIVRKTLLINEKKKQFKATKCWVTLFTTSINKKDEIKCNATIYCEKFEAI